MGTSKKKDTREVEEMSGKREGEISHTANLKAYDDELD